MATVNSSGLGLSLSALLALASGCAGHQAESAPAATTAQAAGQASRPRNFRREPDLARHMQANFWVAVDTRDALVVGDLARAQALARWLADQDMRGVVPPKWEPWVKDLQTSASELADAADLPAAAMAMGSLGVSCGGCHWNFGVSSPTRPNGDDEDQGFAPDGPEDVTTRMLRHEWAADEFWYGLTIPSEESWQSGARVLIESPFEAPMQHEQPVDPDLARGIEALRDFGAQAQRVDTVADRARLYGKLLASCASCHTKGGEASPALTAAPARADGAS